MGTITSGGLRVLVTGGRFWNLLPETFRFLDHIHEEVGISLLIHGSADGADTLCAKWAEERGVPVLSFPVTRDDWNSKGRAAGSLRNQQMLDEGHPDVLVAFPGESGTRDMVQRATSRGLEIWRYQ